VLLRVIHFSSRTSLTTQRRLEKAFEIHLVLIMPSEWLLQVCKNNGSLKSKARL